MKYRDDEEDLSLYARAQDVYKSDKGRADQQERRAREKGELLALQRQVLRGQVQGDKPVPEEGEEATAGDDAVQRADAVAEAATHETFGTKTHREEEQAHLQSAASEQATPDAMLRKQAEEDAQKSKAQEEYQQDAG